MAGAGSYEVQIAHSAVAVAGTTAKTVTAPEHDYTWPIVLNVGDKLYWRVRAVDGTL